MHIVIIWQRFLPYHLARIRAAKKRLSGLGHRLTAVEVASTDASYDLVPALKSSKEFERICCFPDSSYHDHTPGEIRQRVLEVLESIRPDFVFAPASAFPEGMAALTYRINGSARTVIMDDAWECSDRKKGLTRAIKKIIYLNADAAFIPAPSHESYYMKLGFPYSRIIRGVDVVDNGYFSMRAEEARSDASRIRRHRLLPENFFLFVGRFLPRKGIETLLTAYKLYRSGCGSGAWDLVMVGDGPLFENIRDEISGGIHLAGAKCGDDLCDYYGLAAALIVPSDTDPWGLVVNEGMASGLPVIVSMGCGAAATLVLEDGNGWTFNPGDAEGLAALMIRMNYLSPEAMLKMMETSRKVIAEWSLDRFASGVCEAIGISRRPPAGLISDLAVRFWKGRVRTT